MSAKPKAPESADLTGLVDDVTVRLSAAGAICTLASFYEECMDGLPDGTLEHALVHARDLIEEAQTLVTKYHERHVAMEHAARAA